LAKVITTTAVIHTITLRGPGIITQERIQIPNAFEYQIIYSGTGPDNVHVSFFRFCICGDVDCFYCQQSVDSLQPFQLEVTSPFFDMQTIADSKLTLNLTITAYSRTPSSWSFGDTPAGVTSNVTSYATGLCQSPWTGVTCVRGTVIALNLRAFGVRGAVPSSIGLLTGLTSLVMSSNSITGKVDSSFGSLVKLNTLDLSSNRFTGSVPPALSRLTSLLYLDLSYNKLSRSLLPFIVNTSTILIAYADGNKFEGEVSSALREAVVGRNMTLTLTDNPELTCYQPECWSSAPNDLKHFDYSLTSCSPTQSPTVVPTMVPTAKPVVITLSSANSNSSSYVVILVVVVVACLAGMAVYLIYRYRFSTTAREARERLERLSTLPVHSALFGLNKDSNCLSLSQLVMAHKHTVNELDADGNTALNIILSRKSKAVVETEAVVLLLEAALPFDTVTGESLPDQVHNHGWGCAVQSDEENVVQAVAVVLDKYPHKIADLTNAADAKGRCC